MHFPPEQLNEKERYYITLYAKQGYQSRNIDTGGGSGKRELGERKQPKTYRQGIEQGKKNSSKEISHLFDKHLNYSTKNNPPTKNQQKAVEKLEDFLNYHKMPEDNGAIDTERLEKEKYGKTVFSGGSK